MVFFFEFDRRSEGSLTLKFFFPRKPAIAYPLEKKTLLLLFTFPPLFVLPLASPPQPCRYARSPFLVRAIAGENERWSIRVRSVKEEEDSLKKRFFRLGSRSIPRLCFPILLLPPAVSPQARLSFSLQ